jgi:hypothetical protein
MMATAFARCYKDGSTFAGVPPMTHAIAIQPGDLEPAMLRRRFKEVQKATENRFQNFQVRVHRSLSWLERAMAADVEQEAEARLLFGWIAFNALYGAWDERTGYAAGDRQSWLVFVRDVVAIDDVEVLGQRLVELRGDITALLSNKYLDPKFWQNTRAAGSFRGQEHKAHSLYHERRWADIATMAVDRVYVLRGQLAHGAATRGSKLNRGTLAPACRVMEGLLGPILKLVIERRADDAWPTLCYPPIEEPPPPPRRRLAR